MAILPKHISKFLASSIAVVALLSSSATLAASKIPVLASFSILADVARQVGGDRVDVHAIVGAGDDAHGYKLKPSDIRKIRASKLLLINGLGFEPASMLRAMRNSKVPLADASKGLPTRIAVGGHHHHHDDDKHDDHDDHDDHHGHNHKKHDDHDHDHDHKKHKGHDDHDDHDHHKHDHDHGHSHGGKNIDPHVWQDPILMQGYAKNIAAALTRADPAGKAYYAQRLASYQQQLRSLNTWVEQQFKSIPPSKRVVLTAHDAFGYYEDRYKVQFASLQGTSGDSQVSAKTMAGLVQFIKAKKARAIFMEDSQDPRLIKQLARESGISVRQQKLYSDALSKSGAANSYIGLIRHNTTAITQALK